METLDDSIVLVQVLACLYLTLSAAASLLLVLGEEDNEIVTPHPQRVCATSLKLDVLRSLKRRLDRAEEEPNKKPKKLFNYESARRAIQEDYLGPSPLFEHQFVRMFRLTRGIVERIINIAGNADEFFTRRYILTTGKPGICPEAKVLMGLQQLAFGVSPSAFLAHYQMGLTTGKACMKELAKVVATSSELREKCLRNMTSADARRVSDLHFDLFGVHGCIGCLDCMHVYWRTCPVAWQGQCQGKDGYASIVLEALTDYTMWFWHQAFGPPGALNDINVWDSSPLLASMLDGTFSAECDFPFLINNTTFGRVWILVDGIYPELSRFFKTISVPLGKIQKDYVKWQESARKSVERAFGILQRKFQMLARPMEQWFSEEITYVVEACIILHNMMVEVRMEREERESEDFYDEEPPNATEDSEEAEDGEAEEQQENADMSRETEATKHSIPVAKCK